MAQCQGPGVLGSGGVTDAMVAEWWEIHWLVVFLEHDWNFIIPIDELIFFRRVETTNQLKIVVYGVIFVFVCIYIYIFIYLYLYICMYI